MFVADGYSVQCQACVSLVGIQQSTAVYAWPRLIEYMCTQAVCLFLCMSYVGLTILFITALSHVTGSWPPILYHEMH